MLTQGGPHSYICSSIPNVLIFIHIHVGSISIRRVHAEVWVFNFHPTVQHASELIPKRGRKQIEINLDACQAYANLKDLMPDAGINKIIQKMKTDLVNIEKNPEEFQKIQSEIQKNGEINYESGNWLDEVDRTTLVPVVTPIEGTPIEINPLRESLQTATYITKNFDSPSYRMGRKIHEAIIADTPPQNQENQQK